MADPINQTEIENKINEFTAEIGLVPEASGVISSAIEPLVRNYIEVSLLTELTNQERKAVEKACAEKDLGVEYMAMGYIKMLEKKKEMSLQEIVNQFVAGLIDYMSKTRKTLIKISEKVASMPPEEWTEELDSYLEQYISRYEVKT